jgi:hypothetical protein
MKKDQLLKHDGMKIYCWLIALVFSSAILAQNGNPTTILIRQDTTRLKVDKKIAETILQAAEQGKLKAIDPFTDQRIPAGQLYTWKKSADTILRDDSNGITKPEIVQQYRKAEAITQVRVVQDWYLDVNTGQFISRVRWIELLEEVRSSSGVFVGVLPFCRVYY